MSGKLLWKFILIAIVIGGCIFYLYPSLEFHNMTKEEQHALRDSDNERYKDLVSRAIKLGLDLQGGMHLVMEVDVPELLDKLATNKDTRFEKALNAAAEEVKESEEDLVATFDRHLSEMGVDLSLYYGHGENRHSTREEIVTYLQAQTGESVDRALRVLRNRIDAFGVAEPSIQKKGGNRIIIELAGVEDPDRAKGIVGQTASLDMRLLKDINEAARVFQRVNDHVMGIAAEADTNAIVDAGEAAPDSSEGLSADEFLGGDGEDPLSEALGGADTSGLDGMLPEGELMEPLFFQLGGTFVMKESHLNRLTNLMNDDPDSTIAKIVELEAGQNAELLVGTKKDDFSVADDGSAYLEVFLCYAEPELTGEAIVDADHQIDQQSMQGGAFETGITFSDEGAADFSRVTGANVGKRLAIVLDKRVQSAPNIQGKIRNGRARITGLGSIDEAKDLATVLKAGALPAPLEFIEERSVGASLGEDSINDGQSALLWGLLLVAIFMIFYYKVSGIIADLALILNVVILMGFMASLHATLTLPGIAGIVLTIGMAVDANVLIFERIREELAVGKATWAALDTGYGRAFITILDANVTTFIAGVVLYQFGTGPIRGFATTLMIGIAASMFTAIFVSRAIYEFLLSRRILKKISI